MIECSFCFVKFPCSKLKDSEFSSLENLCENCYKLHKDNYLKSKNSIEYMLKEWEGKAIKNIPKGNFTELL